MQTKKTFSLELYGTGDDEAVLGCWRTYTQVHFSVGDVIHTAALLPDEPNRRLKVVRVEHGLWLDGEDLIVKSGVFTTAA